MLYLVQEDLYYGSHEEALLHSIIRNKLDHQTFKIKSLIENIDIDRKDVFIFGGVMAAHIAKKYNWYPGSFYNENHDFVVYSKYYGENMLNHDSIIQKLSDPITIEGKFFVRPTGDTKSFKGEVYENTKMWDLSVSHSLVNGRTPTLNENTLIQVCSIKNILQEYRCFVVKGKVITSSMYKLGVNVIYKECFEEDILNFAQKMVDIYQPSDAFVIDVCRCDNGIKVVEINCINCSGFYDINISKLLQSLEENFN